MVHKHACKQNTHANKTLRHVKTSKSGTKLENRENYYKHTQLSRNNSETNKIMIIDWEIRVPCTGFKKFMMAKW